MAFTDANDWLDRFKRAGFSMKVDAVSMKPASDSRNSDSASLWSEIRGVENRANWSEVETEVRKRIGSIVGWNDFPIKG